MPHVVHRVPRSAGAVGSMVNHPSTAATSSSWPGSSPKSNAPSEIDSGLAAPNGMRRPLTGYEGGAVGSRRRHRLGDANAGSRKLGRLTSSLEKAASCCHRLGHGGRRRALPRRAQRRSFPAVRVPGADRPERSDGSHRRALRARRARVRRREERHHQGLRQPRRHDPDRVRRPAHERAQLLGPRPARARARPEVPDHAYVYVLYTYDAADRRHRAAVGNDRRGHGPLPDAAGPTTTAAWSAAGCRGCRRPAT